MHELLRPIAQRHRIQKCSAPTSAGRCSDSTN
jgi:hypothetical protein